MTIKFVQVLVSHTILLAVKVETKETVVTEEHINTELAEQYKGVEYSVIEWTETQI